MGTTSIGEPAVRPWGPAGPRVAFAGDVLEPDRPDIAQLLATWDQGLFADPTLVRELAGGANNRNYIVESRDRKYALRICNAQSDRLAVDRANAIQAQQDAAAVDLAPPLLAHQLPAGHALSGFLEGRTLKEEELRDIEILRLVGGTFRALHAASSTCRTCSPFSDIRHWHGLAVGDGTALPDDLGDLLRAMGEVERVVDALGVPAVFCHNDTVPQNFVLAGDRLRLVDWDYAGRGLACFELASFCATADLDQELESIVLEAYDPGVGREQQAMVALLRFVAALRECVWAIMATPFLAGSTSVGSEFYVDYRDTHLEMARAIAGGERFGPQLKLAGQSTPRPW
jgi:thiamine kinase-like enzyme